MRDDDQHVDRVIGSVRAIGRGTGAVRMDSLHETEPDDLWSALTGPPRLARWIADIAGDLRIGSSFSARFTSGWEGSGRIDECDRPRRLVVTMAPGTSDETVIAATLSRETAGTRLVVEESGIPLSEIGAHGAGWQAHMEDLAAFLAGDVSPNWHARWTVLAPTYEQMAHGLEST